MTRLISRCTATLAAIAVISSCSGGGGDTPGPVAPPTAPPTVANIEVSVGASTLAVGVGTTATAVLRSASGALLSGRAVAWSSNATAVATVDAGGVVLAVGAGTATITATSEGRSGSTTITVTPVPVASVAVSVPSDIILVNASTQAAVVVLDAGGQPLTGRTIMWSTNAPQIASVTNAGVVQGVAPGVAMITASSEGESGSAQVTIRPIPVATVSVTYSPAGLTPGRTAQATPVLRDASGTVLAGRSVSWSSSNEAIATVSGTGLITAVGVGTTSISASSEGVAGSVQVTVANAPVGSVVVSPATASLATGQNASLQATLRDDLQNLLSGRNVSWSTDNSAVATVSAAGLVSAVAPGSAIITATSEGKSGSATITVSSAAVASVTLSSGSFALVAGDVRAIIATARDAQGNVLQGRTVSWFSSNLTVIDGFVFGDTAVVTGLQSGSAVLTAQVEGRQASLTVTVLAPTVNVCTAISGASIVANDGRYLGRFTNRFDAESVLNQFGQYGSRFAAYSTNNEYGTYGSPYSSQSARNPYTSTPPVIVKNGQAIAFYTVNTSRTPSVAPAYALTCNFP